jgi:hypothetical protein
MSYRRLPGIESRLGLWVLIAVSLMSVTRLIGQEKGKEQKKGGGDETGAYEVVLGWPEHPREGWVSGPVTAIFAESRIACSSSARELKQPNGQGNRAQPQSDLFDPRGRRPQPWETLGVSTT